MNTNINTNVNTNIITNMNTNMNQSMNSQSNTVHTTQPSLGKSIISSLNVPLNFTSNPNSSTASSLNPLSLSIPGVTTTISSFQLESNMSQPFVVMTNENQWDYSAGLLLKRDTFENNQNEVSWPQFANYLQIHFLRATRQDVAKPMRALCAEDFEYLFTEKFNRKMMLTQKDVDIFWEWFGPALHKIRHQKAFFAMWIKGLVYGFVSKPVAEQMLKRERAGTFIVRFSERKPGKVTIAYSQAQVGGGENEVNHFMIDPNDKKDTIALADFLQSKDNLHFVIQLSTEFGLQGDQRIKKILSKQIALKDHLTKKPNSATLDGYKPEM